VHRGVTGIRRGVEAAARPRDWASAVARGFELGILAMPTIAARPAD
jgi:hypothetical protein